MKTPKTAREWNQKIEDAMNLKGGFDTPDEVIAFIKAIQLDARICALHEAAGIAGQESFMKDSFRYNGAKAAHDAIISHAKP